MNFLPRLSAWRILKTVIIPLFILGFGIMITVLIQISGEGAVEQQVRERLVIALLVTLMSMLCTSYSLLLLYRHRLDMLSQLDDERTAMLDIATHQLSTPLATFRWWLELLREDKQALCKQEDIMIQLQEGVDRMSSIIKSLREAGNLERKSFRYMPMCTDVQEMLTSSVKEVQFMLRRRKQAVRYDIQQGTPSVCIDRKLFEGVFRELLENASAYSKDNAEIVLSAKRDGPWIEIRVTDHGIGIPAEDIPHLFEKFRRGSNAGQKRTIGSGMGLYIAKNVVQRSGGTIGIESVINQGTSVIVRLPATHT